MNYPNLTSHLNQTPRIDLILALVDHVTRLPSEAMELSHEVLNSGGGTFEPSCGAICCAWGWAPSVPALAAEGLVREDTGGVTPAVVWRREDGDVELYWGGSAGDFFGLNRTQTRNLFTWRGDSDYDPAGVTNDESDLLPQLTDQVLFRIRVAALLKELGRLEEMRES